MELIICEGTEMYESFFALFFDLAIEDERERKSIGFFLLNVWFFLYTKKERKSVSLQQSFVVLGLSC